MIKIDEGEEFLHKVIWADKARFCRNSMNRNSPNSSEEPVVPEPPSAPSPTGGDACTNGTRVHFRIFRLLSFSVQ